MYELPDYIKHDPDLEWLEQTPVTDAYQLGHRNAAGAYTQLFAPPERCLYVFTGSNGVFDRIAQAYESLLNSEHTKRRKWRVPEHYYWHGNPLHLLAYAYGWRVEFAGLPVYGQITGDTETVWRVREWFPHGCSGRNKCPLNPPSPIAT